jgi:hypothetical protein
MREKGQHDARLVALSSSGFGSDLTASSLPLSALSLVDTLVRH